MWSQAVLLDVCSARGMVGFAVAICLAHCAHSLVACVRGHRWPTLPPPPPFPPAHPLICGIRDISGSAENKSQNQPVHPVAM